MDKDDAYRRATDRSAESPDPLTKRIAREGEQEYAAIMRQRSGIDAGSIDMGVRVEAVSNLCDADQVDIVATAFCLTSSVIKNVRPANRHAVKQWLERLAKQFTLASAMTILLTSATWSHAGPADFLLAPGDGRAIPQASLSLPAVTGETIRVRPYWSDWKERIERERARAKGAGKKYTILVMGGFTEQPWLDGNLRVYLDAAASLGAKYASDPACWGVHVTGCSEAAPDSDRQQYGASEEHFWSRQAFTPAVEAACKRLIAAWAKAFPRQKILLAVSPRNPEGLRRLIDYGQATAPGRFVVKINSLGPQTRLDAPQVGLLFYAAKKGCGIGFEANKAWGSLPDFDKAMGTWASIEKKAGVKSSFNCYYWPDGKFLR